MNETFTINAGGLTKVTFSVSMYNGRPENSVFLDSFASTMDAMSIAGWYLEQGCNPAGVMLYFKDQAFLIRTADDSNYFKPEQVKNHLALSRMFEKDKSYLKSNGFHRFCLGKSKFSLMASPNYLFRKDGDERAFVLVSETFGC